LLRERPIALQAGGQSFVLAPEGAIPLEIWSKRYFEKHELDLIVGALRPGMTFIDVGANVGLFSIPAAKKVQHGKVYAFEPSAWTFELLAKNAGLNNVTNLETVRSAVGDYIGEATLQVNVAGKDGLNTIGKPVHEDSEIVSTEKVPITTLDDFLRQRSLLHVDVMKVDVEGAELMVFRGSKGLLAKSDAPLILYESGVLTKGLGYHPVETMWLLEQYAYSLFKIDSRDGRVVRLTGLQSGDTMLIAAKPTHPFYAVLEERAR
jgi:FkbM family methyltransferase